VCFNSLLLRFQLRVVFTDERLYLRRAPQDAEPLLFIERHREPAHTVQGETAFLAHLERKTALVFVLELGILCPKAFQFRLHLRFSYQLSLFIHLIPFIE